MRVIDDRPRESNIARPQQREESARHSRHVEVKIQGKMEVKMFLLVEETRGSTINVDTSHLMHEGWTRCVPRSEKSCRAHSASLKPLKATPCTFIIACTRIVFTFHNRIRKQRGLTACLPLSPPLMKFESWQRALI